MSWTRHHHGSRSRIVRLRPHVPHQVFTRRPGLSPPEPLVTSAGGRHAGHRTLWEHFVRRRHPAHRRPFPWVVPLLQGVKAGAAASTSTAGVFLGGLTITGAQWCDAHAVLVRFTSTYTDKLYQLYAGRTLIGATSHRDSRAVLGQLTYTHYPQVLQLLAVPPRLVSSDFGSALPPRPYNRARIVLNTTNLGSAAQWIDITAGTEPGGAVDSGNRLLRMNHAGQASHTASVAPLGPSGTWNMEATTRDNKPGGGNAGSAGAFAVDVVTHPPDLARLASNRRFDVAMSSGDLTVSCTLPAD